jgi:hypothetical protein
MFDQTTQQPNSPNFVCTILLSKSTPPGKIAYIGPRPTSSNSSSLQQPQPLYFSWIPSARAITYNDLLFGSLDKSPHTRIVHRVVTALKQKHFISSPNTSSLVRLPRWTFSQLYFRSNASRSKTDRFCFADYLMCCKIA